MKRLLAALSVLLCTSLAALAQTAVVLPYPAQSVADLGNGPLKARVTAGNASIFTSQSTGLTLASGPSTTVVLTAVPTTPPVVGGIISGTGITSGTTVTAYNGVTSLTLSAAATVALNTTVSWGAACPASAASIPTNNRVQSGVTADYYLFYTQARVCAISPGGAVNTLLVMPVFYDSTTPGGGSSSGGSGAVSSVFGRTGAVVATSGDYDVSQVTNALTKVLNSAQFYVGSAGNVATGVPMGGDCALVAAGTVTCTKTNNVSFAASATTDTTNASNISSGTLPGGRLSGSYTGVIGVGALGAGSLAAGFTPVSVGLGGTGQTTQQAGFEALAPTATIAGSIIYWNGSHYVKLDGNASGTKVLQEDASGVPSWVSPSAGSGTVTSITLNGTASNITLSGTCTSTTAINCTVDLAAGRLTVATSISLLSGTSATFNTPVNAQRLKVSFCGGGGGGMGVTNAGAGTAVAGSNGGTTTFNGISAAGGTGGPTTGAGGAGGTGGSGTATYRSPGNPGMGTLPANATLAAVGGNGGGSLCGGGAVGPRGGAFSSGVAAASNSGGGGSGGVGSGSVNFISGGGGGAGEYVYLLLTSPLSSTYTYTVGSSGAGGAGVDEPGGNGGTGVIRVDVEFNFLLKRDVNPAANDNTPMFLNAAA